MTSCKLYSSSCRTLRRVHSCSSSYVLGFMILYRNPDHASSVSLSIENTEYCLNDRCRTCALSSLRHSATLHQILSIGICKQTNNYILTRDSVHQVPTTEECLHWFGLTPTQLPLHFIALSSVCAHLLRGRLREVLAQTMFDLAIHLIPQSSCDLEQGSDHP